MPDLDGHQITITHPDKIVFPEDGITKGELVDYYERIADRMLPHVQRRPLHMNRFPDGIDRFAIQQKRIPESFPPWVSRTTVELHRGGTITHAVIDNSATLVYLANYNMVTAHVWLSRVQAPTRPDQLVFDLDPSDDDFSLVRRTARALKGLLEEIGLIPFVKVTGSRGLHVVTPIIPGPSFEDAHLFADTVGQRLAATDPDHLTTEFLKEKRAGRLFIDLNRNAYAQTTVAAYSVRARRGAPVAAPIAWSEVDQDDLRPDGVTLKSIFDRLEKRDDPWETLQSSARTLPTVPASRRPDRSGRRRGVSRPG